MDIRPLTRIASALLKGTLPVSRLVALSKQIMAGLCAQGFRFNTRPEFQSSNEKNHPTKFLALVWSFSEGVREERLILTVEMSTISGSEWWLELFVSRAADGLIKGKQIAVSRLELSSVYPEQSDFRLDVMYSSHSGKSDVAFEAGDYCPGDFDDADDCFQHFLRQFEAQLTAELAC